MARKGKFEISLKFVKTVQFEPFFFKTGVIIAVLREDRTEPEIREECAILTINEPREGRESSTRLVGQVYTMTAELL